MTTRGALIVTAGGKEYKLWLGMSVLADLQDKHGQDVLQKLDPPANADASWLPPMRVLVDLFLFALERHHADDANVYLVDEIMAENANVFADLMATAFPDQVSQSGNGQRPKRKA